MSRAGQMDHVLWIGGPPGSGKTTVATRLARRYGLRLYSADEQTVSHRDRAAALGIPAALAWAALPPERRWHGPSGTELLAMSLHRERGPMVVQDVRTLPAAPMVVAEGSVLPVSLIATGIATPSRAVWLMPSERFQYRQLVARELPTAQVDLYRALRGVIADELPGTGITVFEFDGEEDLDAVTAELERRFAKAIRAGSQAADRDERRALLHERNQAIVRGVMDFLARGWAAGDPDEIERELVCECGDTACAETLWEPVGAVGPTDRVLAFDHH